MTYTPAIADYRRREFQRWLGVKQDGAIGPVTLAAFNTRMTNTKAPKVTKAEISGFAATLDVSIKQITAVATVETAGRTGFNKDGRPDRLYERHYFWRLTNGIYPVSVFNNPKGGEYNVSSWGKLTAAIAVDPVAALSSCSWGKFQIMGAHWQSLGYTSIYQFIETMIAGEAEHYEAFVRFIEHEQLQDEMRAISTTAADNVPFVDKYNGPNGVVQNKYHIKLADEMK